MVVMHLPGWRREPWPPRVPYIVVKDEYATGTKRSVQQLIDFGIIDALDLIGIIKIDDCCRCLGEGKAVSVEREFRFAATCIFDPYFAFIIDAVPLRHPGGRIDAIVGRLFRRYASGSKALR